MQNKGIVIVTAVLLTLASIFYLSFSVATHYFERPYCPTRLQGLREVSWHLQLPKVFGNTDWTGLGPQRWYECHP